jgi:hypothetical protein
MSSTGTGPGGFVEADLVGVLLVDGGGVADANKLRLLVYIYSED